MLFQLIPRKGTEADNIFAGCTLHEHFNLSPQGDGNGIEILIDSSQDNFNLSPQGDGNEECCISFVRCHPFQLILARGRKPCFDVPKIGVLLFQLIPARGRKPCFDVPKIGVLLFQLIPARGRKPTLARADNTFHNISTYPRKGTETRNSLRACFFCASISTYPRKGTETYYPCG